MTIDRFKQPDGTYLDEQGITHMSRRSLEICTRFTSMIADRKNRVWEHIETYEEWRKRKDEHFKTDGAEYFAWYYLDNLNLIEHGVSVPGWLTDEGEEMLADLNELIPLIEAEADRG